MSDNKIKVDTSRFGEVEILKEKIYSFPDGIPGFADCKKYCILDNSKNTLFKWLQSVDNPDLAFVLFDPFLIKKDYDVFVNDGDVNLLEIESNADVIVTVILTIPNEKPENMTANLKAPVIFNIKKKIGKQIILNEADQPLEFPIWSLLTTEADKKSKGAI